MNLFKPTLDMYFLFKILTKVKKIFILIFELNSFLSSIYQSIFPSYFSFMLQGTCAVYFTMLSPYYHIM
jgi:hypothetical protein